MALTEAEELREFIKNRVSPETLELLAGTDKLTTYAQIFMADTGTYTAKLDKLCKIDLTPKLSQML